MEIKNDTKQNSCVRSRENQLANLYFSPDNYYYEAVSNIAKAGSWSVDFINKRSFLDRQARKILKAPHHYTPTLREGHRFYADEHLQKAESLFIGCSTGRPFTAEIKMKTYTGEVFWARAQGKPIRNSRGEVTGIRGVFQNIDAEKNKEQGLEVTEHAITHNKKWLQDFSNVVVHALRTHISNLQLSLTLFEKNNLDKDQVSLFSNVESIGNQLDISLKHLDVLNTLQNSNQQFETVNIEETYKKVALKIVKSGIQQRSIFFTEFF